MLILDGLLIVLILLFKHETFGPQLLYYKARFFRQATGDPRFKTEIEASGVASVATTLRRHFSRPWILAIEPIVIFMTFYLTVVYIVLFTFLDGLVLSMTGNNSLDCAANVLTQLSVHLRPCPSH